MVTWLNHEEALFRRLENRIVSERLMEGFIEDGEADVDGFVKFSLSLQNRRKSRMGYSFEHHISAALDANDIRYASQLRTIKGKKPDYVFPSADAYVDLNFPTDRLTMLAAKSTCKERWSQVLSEADRIPEKHLITLEPRVPETTTATMRADNLRLVVPSDRHMGYSAAQRTWLLSFADFIAIVADRQTAASGDLFGH